jgi:hypothetical protein
MPVEARDGFWTLVVLDDSLRGQILSALFRAAGASPSTIGQEEVGKPCYIDYQCGAEIHSDPCAVGTVTPGTIAPASDVPYDGPVPVAFKGVFKGVGTASPEAATNLPPDLAEELSTIEIGLPSSLLAQIAHVRREARAPYKKGPDKKKKIVEQRNRIIAGLHEVGITEPNQILAHLRDNYPNLIRKGKGTVDADSIMRAYRKPG